MDPSEFAGRSPTSTATPNESTPATMPAAGRAPPFDVRATVLSSTT